jgi:hypothetical protein
MKRFILIVALLSAGPSWGASPGSEDLDARALGMGGALRSLANTVSAARYNPAGLSAIRGFFAGMSYATQTEGAFDAVQITLVDNITSPMGGALQYVRLQGEEEREDIGLSLSAGGKGLWWGFTVRYVHARNRDAAEWNQLFTGDVGFLIERPGDLRIAAVGYDLLDTTSPFLERRVALAASKTWAKDWTVAVDLVRNLDNDFNKGLDLHVGVEYRRPTSRWIFRGGEFWEGSSGKDYTSLGVGWSLPVNLDLGYALRVSRQDPSAYLNVLTFAGSF